MAASRVAGRYLVLDHLDVGQPYPFIRLWERWGLGEGPPREETRRHRSAEPPWSQPRPSPPPDHRHRRPRREDPPAPTFREAPRESDPIWDDEVSADGREDERPPSDFETHDDEDRTRHRRGGAEGRPRRPTSSSTAPSRIGAGDGHRGRDARDGRQGSPRAHQEGRVRRGGSGAG